MDSIRVYTRRILDDLNHASRLFSDVELVSKGQKITTSSLILASLSGMMNDALKDLMYENVDEKIQVIIPDAEIDFHLVSTLFSEVLFDSNEELELDEKYHKVLDYFDIKSSFESKSAVVGISSTTYIKHVCQFCEKSFNLKKLLSRHVRTFHSENPFKCVQCGRLCRNQSELKIHQRVHTKERPHKCFQCRRSFTQVSHLNEHIKNIHYGPDEITSGKNICEICGLILSSKNAVQRHMKQHEGVNSTLTSPRPLSLSPLPSPHPPSPDPPQKYESILETKAIIDESVIEQLIEKPTMHPLKLMCDYEGCGKVLKTHSSLKLHINTHNSTIKERRPYTCSVCQKSFTQKSHLTVHMRIHSGAKPHMCSFCGKQFSVRSNMKKHLKMHEKVMENDNAATDAIELIISDPEQQQEQPNFIQVKENKSCNTNVCEFCGKSFGSINELELHVKVHTHEKPFECMVCFTAFATRSAMRIHEKIHTGEEQHVCHHCHLTCVSRSALDKHILIHTGEKPFDCPMCGKKFKQKSHVNYHIKTVHGDLPKDRPKNHICFHCGSAFTTASTLRKHAKIHTGERPHICKYCNKGFIQKVHLQTHLLRHSGDKPWLCNVCGKGFVTNAVLKEHTKLHTGVKMTFSCQLCDMKYANAADLKVHERRHTGESPFICNKCHKSFRSKRLLQDHERTHLDAGSKPFICGNCNKTFASASSLRQHFKRNDTCKLASLPGSFSLVQDLVDKETSATDDAAGTLLVDFLPQPSANAPSQSNLQEDVILIDASPHCLILTSEGYKKS